MKVYLLKYFAWISLVCIFSFSCRSSRIFLSDEQAGKIRESFLNGSFEKNTFKAKVIFHKNELSGLILIKQTEDGNVKISFYNELGMTYLEGTFENSSKHKKLIIKNIVPALNHKPFIKSFEKGMQLLFSKQNPPITQSTNPPITQSTNPPITQSTNPPYLPASPLPGIDKSTLKVQLRNGFILELSPQISRINTE